MKKCVLKKALEAIREWIQKSKTIEISGRRSHCTLPHAG